MYKTEEEKRMNNIKVFGLMAGLTALFMGIGYYFMGGSGGAMTMLLFAGLSNFVMYFISHKMVLRMYQAKIVTAAEAPQLYEMVDRLRQRAGLPMPTVAIAPHAQPNAFATGRNPQHAVVCVTEGIVNLLTKEELEGVIAHELAHIKNRDMLLQTIAATFAAAISHLAFVGMFMGGRDNEDRNPMGGILMMILAPMAASIIQMAISRQREFKADAVGAEICGKPLALASSLRKLEEGARRMPMQLEPAAAPLAQVNPFGPAAGGFLKLFSTHPPTEERIARLQALSVQYRA
jgi:heat shock protein HtpX